ncbi:hypothetical protein Q9L42_000620 [Methylomarinum sp. Ch1-1]|uniref:Rad50/SbcC-type AAA domain-containing protein n=1 Tax=Methylomarinum roseum TaxID=3067653 RepID=A0AAU7NUF9_9GAMM
MQESGCNTKNTKGNGMKPVNSSDQLSWIVIEGYKSISKCELKMGCLNVLIGANGAGKSNFIQKRGQIYFLEGR